MNAPAPNDFPRELLAAYVDGELDDAGRDAVERWLAEHPEAVDLLNAQRELAPSNRSLWDRAEPPEPSGNRWAAARCEIESGLEKHSPWRWRTTLATAVGLAAAGIAAAVAWIALVPGDRSPQEPEKPVRELAHARPAEAPAPREVPAPQSDDPLAGFAVLPIATDRDVILDRVPEFPKGWLPVGQHPLQAALSLASTAELQVAEFAPSPVWPTGGPKMTTSPGDAPMIYAGKLR